MINDSYNDNYDETCRKAMKAKPEHNVRAMLSLHTAFSLKELARMYGKKNYGSSRKSDIIDYLCKSLTDSELVESMLLLTNDEESRFFEEVASSAEMYLPIAEAHNKPYHFLHALYFLEIYHTSGKIVFVVPDELRRLFEALSKTSFPETHRRYKTISRAASAFATVYGVVDLDAVIEFCEEQLQCKFDFIEFSNILYDIMRYRDVPYRLFCETLIYKTVDSFTEETEISEYVVEESNEEIYRIESLRGEIPMKALPPENLLKHANPYYIERTVAHDALIAFLGTVDSGFDETPILEQIVLVELNKILVRTDNPQCDIPYVDLRKFESDDMFMIQLRNLFDEVEQHTRKWSKNGWTVAELRERSL